MSTMPARQDKDFHDGVVTVILVVAFIGLLFSTIFLVVENRELTNTLQKREANAVRRGHAVWTTDQHNRVRFRWAPPAMGAEECTKTP